MKLTNKTILIISPEPWNHVFVSKHHYAIHLARKGNKVFFLNPPTNENKVTSSSYENLSILDYKGFIKGLRYLPSMLRRLILNRKLIFLEGMAHAFIDVIWSFDNSVFFDFDSFPKRIFCISHIMDLNQDFQFKRAASSAAICFGVIPEIVNRLKKFNSNSYLIRHGVSKEETSVQKKNLPGTRQLKALYVGNLNMPHLDWELLLCAGEKYLEVDFVCLGSNPHADENSYKWKFARLPNAYFLDPVPSKELSGYLLTADVLLLAYTPQYYVNYASPHKLLEYLAAGKPIVGSFTPDYSAFGDLIYMGKDHSEWLKQFQFVITNLELCSSFELSHKRISFALDNTYEKQIGKIEDLVAAF